MTATGNLWSAEEYRGPTSIHSGTVTVAERHKAQEVVPGYPVEPPEAGWESDSDYAVEVRQEFPSGRRSFHAVPTSRRGGVFGPRPRVILGFGSVAELQRSEKALRA